MKVYFDGGCRPARMETAVVVQGRTWLQPDLGPGTSMDAEWLALRHAVTIARTLGLASPVFLGDALAVIQQATMRVKCQPGYAHHLQALDGPLRLRHIKRTQNLAGIALARLHDR